MTLHEHILKLALAVIVVAAGMFGRNAVNAADLQLEVPVACVIGTDCWIQQYADHDPGTGAADYQCGGETYDGHDGTDFRISNATRHVNVIASAAGTVIGGRDGMTDHLVRTEEDKRAVANRECGNGVVIDHGNGWQTQYCHMRRGSVVVRKGQKVSAGETLGQVGYSGAAAFPHVHLSVRKDGRKLDPFSGDLTSACQATGTSLWSPGAAQQLRYEPGAIIALSFNGQRFSMNDLDLGALPESQPKSDWPEMIAYVHAINLRQGDVLAISLSGPAGPVARREQTLDRNKAEFVLLADDKMPAGGWPAGHYTATATVTNSGETRLSRTASIEIAP